MVPEIPKRKHGFTFLQNFAWENRGFPLSVKGKTHREKRKEKLYSIARERDS